MNYETLPISKAEFEKLALFHKVEWGSVAGYFLGINALEMNPGEVLISPKESNTNMYIILEGVLEVHLESSSGLLVSTMGQGECVGEMSVFDNADPSAWVVVKEKARLLPISREIALALIHASHDLCLNLLHILSQRLRHNNKVITADKHHIRRIEEHASVDALTGLHNRRWMDLMFPREVNRSHCGKQPLSAFMIDLDHFKTINDRYGHLNGDLVLSAVAQVISLSLRPTDMIVRYGGEEIAVLLPNAENRVALEIAERLRSNIAARAISLGDQTIHVTASIGIASLRPGDTVESLLERADKALYQAKSNGRNRCEFLEAI